ncbi:MAG: hypothetical protein CME82_15890 [Halomonas sp.]|nr:hypothetical protein [Halomonas sp.]
MNHQDLVAIEHALTLANRGDTCWLCTRLDTPAPASPHLSVTSDGDGPRYAGQPVLLTDAWDGGTCLANINNANADDAPPCLVERLSPTSETLVHLEVIHATLAGQPPLIRRVSLLGAPLKLLRPAPTSPLIHVGDDAVEVLIQPALRLVLIGHSPTSIELARQGQRLGFEVILCAPGSPDTHHSTATLPTGVEFQRAPAAPFLRGGSRHRRTLVMDATDASAIARASREACCSGYLAMADIDPRQATNWLYDGWRRLCTSPSA